MFDAYVIKDAEFKDQYLVDETDPAARRLGIPPTRSSKMQMYLISEDDTKGALLSFSRAPAWRAPVLLWWAARSCSVLTLPLARSLCCMQYHRQGARAHG